MVRKVTPRRSAVLTKFSQSPRTLVIIIGSLRGGELAWNSFYSNVLEFNRADLALCIGKGSFGNSSLIGRAKYIWEFEEFDDWADAIDLIHDSSWRSSALLNFFDHNTGLFGGVNGRSGSGAVIFMARWFAAQSIIRLDLTSQYDRFVVTRSDHYYLCPHDLTLLDSRFMWVPDYEAGITDRHLVCNAGQILPALDVLPPIVKFPEKYMDETFKRYNPELLLLLRWKDENLWKWVKHFDRIMFTCADDGDKTRWSVKAPEKSAEGVYQKYPKEYIDAHCYCKGGPGSVLIHNDSSKIATCMKENSSIALFSLWFDKFWKPVPSTN